GAVIASTLTTVAVFFPVVFVEGIAGQAFGDLGWAVVISQIASLLVAIYFIPMLASRQKSLARQEHAAAKPWASFWSWLDFNEKRRATPKPLLYIAMPWFLVRLLVAFVLEVVAKLLLLILGATLWLLARLLRPAALGVGQFLLSPVVRLSGAFFERLGRAYPRAIHW